jgi:hypothetical protein
MIRPLPNHQNLSHHEGARSFTSSNEEASSLIISSVSTQLKAVRLNGQCTIQLVESVMDMVTNLIKEVIHLKNENILLRQ